MKDFIDKRRNKDNFINIMFWLAMQLSFFIGLITGIGAIITYILAALIVPIIIGRIHEIKVNKEGNLINKDGIDITDRLPKNIYYFHVLAILFPTPVTLYFIIKNCPISVVFNFDRILIPNDMIVFYNRKKDD